MSSRGNLETEESALLAKQETMPGASNEVVGLQLINGSKAEASTNLGILVLPSLGKYGLTVGDIRQHIEAQIVARPTQYSICTKQGWPVTDTQEKFITLPQILTEGGTIQIRVEYDLPKLGIRNRDSEVIGFVHVSYSSNLRSIKQTIYQQVLEPLGYPQSFHFLDSNSWPISSVQELLLTVVDVMIGSCVAVDTSAKRRMSQDFSPPKLPPDKRFKETKQLSFRSGKDIYRPPSVDVMSANSGSKPILISYVRAEAAKHALFLKEELSALGLSVYLDVHEIQTGVDWQDSLNFAVSGCDVFVPLVTLKYGLTQWTNREVKLADVLGKYIIPVNFLQEWPPRCLAIQFASTQFIPWIPPDLLKDKQSKLCDLSVEPLDMAHLKTVAGKIADRVKGLRLTSVPSLMKRATIVKSCAMVKEANSMATTADREGKPLVVICLHPAEKQHGAELSVMLEKEGFEVWCTTELDRKHLDHIDGLSSSQEGESYLVSLGQGCYGEEGRQTIQVFQEKADDASVVLCVLSQAFSQSRTCQQQGVSIVVILARAKKLSSWVQVFYCEHRKRIIYIMYEDFQIPEWMAMLIGSQGFQLRKDEHYKDFILHEVRAITDRSSKDTNGASMSPTLSPCQSPTSSGWDKNKGSGLQRRSDCSQGSQVSPTDRSPSESPVKRPSLSSMKTIIL